MPTITMNVNGTSVSAQVENRTVLSAALREELGLTGTHIGCATSLCGACVVHVSVDGSLNVIQQAVQDHHGLQCGFCTPGMIMSAAALLKENPKPTEAEIRDYLEGNICRCTGYQGIVNAIMAASGQLPAMAAE